MSGTKGDPVLRPVRDEQSAWCELQLKPEIRYHILGKAVTRRTTFDSDVVQRAVDAIANPSYPAIDVCKGKTLCATGFYEQQARVDGAWATHDRRQAVAWLRHLHSQGRCWNSLMCRCLSTSVGE